NHLPPVVWFIEVKSRKIGDNKFHPLPRKFAKLVYDVIKPFNISDRVIIKSFDAREIKELHRIDPSLKLGLLVIRSKNVKRKIKALGFTPYAFNPNYKFLSKKTVNEIHTLGMKTYVWTVNSKKEIARMESYGVDGIITDYPFKPR
ncbi:MAG TPA: glycerophosphodiester phosphodiesterase family protein, partial [Bacteroidia bacterium]